MAEPRDPREPRIPKETAPFDADNKWTRTWIMYFESLFTLSVKEAVRQTLEVAVTHTDDLTKDLPVFGNDKADIKVGTKSGNTNKVVTNTGTNVTGNTVKWDATGNLIDAGVTPGGGGGGSGTVTSVALTVPAEFSVSGSPVTTSGTLAVSKATQSANTVFAGPTTGSAAAPTFRAVDPADLPLATSSAFGAVKVDGTTITASSGVISAAAGSSVIVGPDTPPASPSAIDDEFNGSSLNAKWTWVNQGSATATLSASWLNLFAPSSAGDNIRCLVQAMPSTPWTITAKVSAISIGSDYFFTGLVVRDSGSGKLVPFTMGYAGGESITVWYYNSPTSFNSAPYTLSLSIRLVSSDTLYLRWVDDGTNWSFQYSRNGAFFAVLQAGVSRTAFLASPNQVGIVTNRNNATATGQGLFDWFRKI